MAQDLWDSNELAVVRALTQRHCSYPGLGSLTWDAFVAVACLMLSEAIQPAVLMDCPRVEQTELTVFPQSQDSWI